MFFIIIGTRGQYIKMFPLLVLLEKEKVQYKFVYTAQHEIHRELSEKLKIPRPDIVLSEKKRDLVNLFQVAKWAVEIMIKGLRLKMKKNDWVIIHGETETSFLSLLLAKLKGARAIHIEAGVRSNTLLSPFPEEIIRKIIDRFSDMFFCSYQDDADNLKQKKNIMVIEGNTVYNSIESVLSVEPAENIKKIIKGNPYVIFFARRMETLYSKKKLTLIIDILEIILKKKYKVVWTMHPVTNHALRSKGLQKRIDNLRKLYKLETTSLLNYIDFIHLVRGSIFIAADGAGIQMESYYLNKPMLILREVTESTVGFNETAFLSNLDLSKVELFLRDYPQFKRKKEITKDPSKIILEKLKKLAKSDYRKN